VRSDAPKSDLRARRRHDGDGNRFPKLFVWARKHGATRDCDVGADNVFDQEGRELLSRTVDELLEASGEKEISVCVKVPLMGAVQ